MTLEVAAVYLIVHTGFRPEKQLKKKKYLTIEFGWH